MSVDIKELFEAGAHFGHKTSRWHPKMEAYIHSVKGDQHIINLEKTVVMLEEAMSVVEDVASKGKQVMFIGTKKQAVEPVQRAAEATGMPYVTVRWMGGMLTNHKTMNDRIKHLKKLEERMDTGEFKSRYNKLEIQRFQEEIDDLNRKFGGIKNLHGTPGAVVIVDVTVETIALQEAAKLGVPIIAIVDSNANPDGVTYPIPANDDSIKSVDMIIGHLANAVNDGKMKVKKEAPKAAPVKKTPAAAKNPNAKKEVEKKTDEKKAEEKPAKKEDTKKESK